ncbi:MAG: SDR family oxidoreductase [Pseudomonadota bacterium]
MKQNIPVAIIGMGCFFPKAPGLKGYRRLLFRGIDAITDIPETHWSPEEYYSPDPDKPDHVSCKRGGFLPPVSFDPLEFGIPPSSLEAIDTSQLLALLAAKNALEDAGYGEDRKFNRQKTSVILGVTGTQELVIPLGARLGHPKWRKALKDSGISGEKAEEVIERISNAYVSWQENSFPGLLGNVVAGRICNRLDLGGTNCVVDAACASSMSAIHLSVMELMSGRSDMVITGGVDAINDIFMHMCFSETHTLSRTGDARPFSKDADGTVLGEGIGTIVLKRLQDAEKDGDRVYAVIRAVGSSSDGKSQSIYAPRIDGQVNALRAAYANAGVDPATIELIEAHGTGTRVGDTVEFQALAHFFGEHIQNTGICAVGSVKSMIGHTKAAAGAAGLIKSVLSLYNKILPPTLKADEPDPGLKIHKTPFYLSTKTRPWFSKKEHPRRSGVSAFGFGGSNFHVVLEEHVRKKPETAWDGSVEILALSASSRTGLLKNLRSFIRDIQNDPSYEDFSARAAGTRQKFSSSDPHRLLFVVERPIEPDSESRTNTAQLLSGARSFLESNEQKNRWHAKNAYYGGPEAPDKPDKIAFLFPGQGSQYVGMGRDLVCCFPAAFEILESANGIFENAQRLSDFIFPPPAQSENETTDQEKALQKTDVAQPALGAVSLAMLEILREFGIHPDATCGHSFGELTALAAAGRLNIDALIRISISRGRCMAQAGRNSARDAGTMLAVNAPLDELAALTAAVGSGVVLANRNTPNQGVLSGTLEAIDRVDQVCRQKGFRTVRLPVSAAFHSDLVADAQKPFAESLRDIVILPTDIPVFSNTTANPYPADAGTTKNLLAEQMLCPVDFVNEIKNMFDSGIRTFVEVGPKSVLTGLVKSILKNRRFQALALDSSSGKQYGIADLARVLCHLASQGRPVELTRWEGPVSVKRKQMMRIPICGANHRNMDNNPKKTNQPNAVLDALKVVQEGLKSMQALQMQTAEAHKKFLESQTEAGRALQNMMENTRRLVQASLGLDMEMPASDFTLHAASEKTPVAAEPPARKTTDKNRALEPAATAQIRTPGRVPTIETIPMVFETPPDDPAHAPANGDTEQNSRSRKEIEQSMLEVVCRLTGYPEEMLKLDMDIEADLGIDSIKRVEILSALEEKIPDLPSISPEKVGKLKTLGQIVEYLSAGTETAAASLPSGPAADSTPIREKSIQNSLLEVVSRLTGYPEEMLKPDMDIEADLGIDSIKRVEILSALEEKMPDLPSISPEKVGKLKTLGQIAGYLSGNEDPHAPPSKKVLTASTDAISDTPIDEKRTIGLYRDNSKYSPEALASKINRKVVSMSHSPADQPAYQMGRLSIPGTRKVYITNDRSGLSKSICGEFAALNIDAVLLSDEHLSDIVNGRKRLRDAGGLVIVPDFNSADDRFLKDAFLLTKHAAPGLLDSAAEGGALFASVTRLDGAFGFKGQGVVNPVQGGLAGLVKTASLEWDGVVCRAIDVAPDWRESGKIAKSVVTEILNPDPSSPVEIGLGADGRRTFALESSPYPDGRINLDPGDVVVITGGARGVTAYAAQALARQAKPTLVLMGRSPEPSPEPEWLTALHSEADVKKAILENEYRGRNVTPVQIEASFKKHTANREISKNLEMMSETAANVLYYSVDVRDAEKVSSILDEVRLAHGPIAGVIHGAGVLEDRLIVDKTMDQFDNVYDPKVEGLRVLLEATRPDPLKYLVLFSSVTARIGNIGQADYAMANEVLNKIAQQEATARPDCRVVSINWGPWDGGMVCSALKRKFEKNNIDLIPPEAGAMCMIYEMAGERGSPAEVVIGANVAPDKGKAESRFAVSRRQAARLKNEKLSLALKREIDIHGYPILQAHILDGKPVVPFALIAEWLGYGALHENPGLTLHGLDDMRVLIGIKLDSEKKIIRLMAGKARKNGSHFSVDVEVRDGIHQGVETIHSRATAVLTDELTPPPYFDKTRIAGSKAYPRSMDEVYDKILFHGSELRGIREIINCSPRGMAARIAPAPSPLKWMTDPIRSRWIGDPLVLDSAFQMAIVWCFEEKGMVSLPSYTASYRQYRTDFPGEGVTAVLEVKQVTERKMVCDFTFLDANDVVVATLAGHETVMDASLSRAFKSRTASHAA